MATINIKSIDSGFLVSINYSNYRKTRYSIYRKAVNSKFMSSKPAKIFINEL